MSTTGTGLIQALGFTGFDPINNPVEGQSNYGGVDITNWTSIKNGSFGTNYVIDTVEDAGGKFRTVYIPSSTVAQAIQYDLYQKTGISYQMISGYSGAAIIDAVHAAYQTYLSRPPELAGLYYWVTQIIVNGQTLASMQSNIAAAATQYTSTYGSPFAFKWNTSLAGVDVSSYSIPSVPQASYQGSPWVFLRTGQPSSHNDTVESVLAYTSSSSGVYQYFYDSGLTSLTKYYELFSVSSFDALIAGLNKRLQNNGQSALFGQQDLNLLTTIYNYYWNIPTSISSVDGLGRAPDLDGFLYWASSYYTGGYTIDQIRSQFFSASQPEVQAIQTNGINSVPRASGVLSNTRATNYSVGTNAGSLFVNKSTTSIVTTPNITTAVTNVTSTGSVSSNTTSSLTVSSTNNNGFVQQTAATVNTPISYTPLSGDDSGFYMGSDGNQYGAYTDGGTLIYYKIPN